MKLSELKPYAAGTVIHVTDCPAKTRLESMGVRPGALVTRLFTSVCGDPSAYSVDSDLIGIRHRDAERIEVRPACEAEDAKWE